MILKLVTPKKRGRPAKGRDPLVTLRLTNSLIKQVEWFQEAYPGMSFSVALRALIDLGLHSPKAKRWDDVIDPKDYCTRYQAGPTIRPRPRLVESDEPPP